MKQKEKNGDDMMVLKELIVQVNTERILLDKLNFLMREEANIADSFLLWVVEYCKEHNIPVWKEDRFKNLMSDSKQILREIEKTSTALEEVCKKEFLSDEFLQGSKSDEDLTVP